MPINRLLATGLIAFSLIGTSKNLIVSAQECSERERLNIPNPGRRELVTAGMAAGYGLVACAGCSLMRKKEYEEQQ